MNTPRSAISALRWVLGLVVAIESARFAFSSASAHQLAKIGLPSWMPAVLGGAELVAALLFLIPGVRRVGGYALLAIFAIAALIHLLHGQFDVGALAVYAAAVIACNTSEAKP